MSKQSASENTVLSVEHEVEPSSTNHGECAICTEKITRGEHALTECLHLYHRHCLAEWLESNKENQTCPICRKVVDPSIVAPPPQISPLAVIDDSVIREAPVIKLTINGNPGIFSSKMFLDHLFRQSKVQLCQLKIVLLSDALMVFIAENRQVANALLVAAHEIACVREAVEIDHGEMQAIKDQHRILSAYIERAGGSDLNSEVHERREMDELRNVFNELLCQSTQSPSQRVLTHAIVDDFHLAERLIDREAYRMCRYLGQHAQPISTQMFFAIHINLCTADFVLRKAVACGVTVNSIADAIDQGVGKKTIADELRNFIQTKIDFPPSEFCELDSKKLKVDLLLCVVSVSEFKAVLCHMRPLPGHAKILRGVPDRNMYYVGLFGTRTAALVQQPDAGSGGVYGAQQVVGEGVRFWKPTATFMSELCS